FILPYGKILVLELESRQRRRLSVHELFIRNSQLLKKLRHVNAIQNQMAESENQGMFILLQTQQFKAEERSCAKIIRPANDLTASLARRLCLFFFLHV